MSRPKLLLVDFENVPKLDLSVLPESYQALVFVGAGQNPPRASRHPDTKHRFQRVDFQRIEGAGRNALDFHIAFQLGRIFETAPDTECFVVAADKGYDPLVLNLNKNGMTCRRISSLAELGETVSAKPAVALVVCQRCKSASAIEHYGGLWCTNCGCFASPPDQKLLPSNQTDFIESVPTDHDDGGIQATCEWCHQSGDMTGGVYDDGEWMCGHCVAHYANQQLGD